MFYLEIFSIIFPTLLSVAFYTLLEWKVIGSVQRRVGPNYVGFIGILQPIEKQLLFLTLGGSQFIDAPQNDLHSPFLGLLLHAFYSSHALCRAPRYTQCCCPLECVPCGCE